MASRKITFTFPAGLAAKFTSQLVEHDRQLAQSCDLANQDPGLIALERDFDALPSGIQEPWHDAPPR
jgi:hypothetical protein